MTGFSPFRRLLVATGVSSRGDGVRLIAMPLMATRFTSDPQLITGVFVAHEGVARERSAAGAGVLVWNVLTIARPSGSPPRRHPGDGRPSAARRY